MMNPIILIGAKKLTTLITKIQIQRRVCDTMDTTTIIFIAISFVTTTCFGYCLGMNNGYKKAVSDVVRSIIKFGPDLEKHKINESIKKENSNT